MKKIVALLLCTSAIFTSACGSKVRENQKFKDADVKKVKLEYQIYNKDVIDSQFTWYSEYIIDFVESSRVNNYMVDKAKLDAQIQIVDAKLDELKNLNKDYIKKSIDLDAKHNLKNNEEDTVYKNRIKEDKKNIANNINQMEKILNLVKSGLELGKDGTFDQSDQNKLKESQKEIIRIYDNNIKR
ncbi:hypothetical protein [Peptostreptococcus equinus]|uniref:Lipoprotein n=1 Tax=Peptostreptococcus equinus TaxID=3003601 RepID=A0ABY7JQX3_9FIRM|nr:hypothetical protein [Peptostreptococcus sp. CBA3647]WAW15762.1 hypothetical protein O0R46_04735 [Peptostreptococcus sp. CBA3647]